MTQTVDLDARVLSSDPDRWLSSRFVSDEARRADLIALYAFEAELMAIPIKVTQPLLAEMRYAWWAEQLDGVWPGEPRRGHPVLETFAAVVARHALPRAPFEALIEAHIGRVSEQPHDLDAFYVGPMQAAVQVLAGPGHEAAVADAGQVWALTQTGRFDEAEALRGQANRALRALPAEGFPAVAHAALRRPAANPDEAGPRRLRLTWAVMRGRI